MPWPYGEAPRSGPAFYLCADEANPARVGDRGQLFCRSRCRGGSGHVLLIANGDRSTRSRPTSRIEPVAETILSAVLAWRHCVPASVGHRFANSLLCSDVAPRATTIAEDEDNPLFATPDGVEDQAFAGPHWR